eukprot:TRINITY_DN112067_c0_g1_i1.p1 TRINITY_DN112067_c0_g1~~TRINITY_DN112067_c0_g1_i1.p1  ORF type:complete len:1115 (-),score=353.43 TRINITY_DN112067_c0_g1_i1:144-3488(-)
MVLPPLKSARQPGGATTKDGNDDNAGDKTGCRAERKATRRATSSTVGGVAGQQQLPNGIAATAAAAPEGAAAPAGMPHVATSKEPTSLPRQLKAELQSTMCEMARLADAAVVEEPVEAEEQPVQDTDKDSDEEEEEFGEEDGEIAHSQAYTADAKQRTQALLKILNSAKRDKVLNTVYDNLQKSAGPARQDLQRLLKFERTKQQDFLNAEEDARLTLMEVNDQARRLPEAMSYFFDELAEAEAVRQKRLRDEKNPQKAVAGDGMADAETLTDHQLETAIADLQKQLEEDEHRARAHVKDMYKANRTISDHHDDDAPFLLVLASPNGQQDCSGEYLRVCGEKRHTMPVWKHRERELWLFSTGTTWVVSKSDPAAENLPTATIIVRNREFHNGGMPHQLKDPWERLHATARNYVEDPAITVLAPEIQDMLLEQEKAMVWMREAAMEFEAGTELLKEALTNVKLGNVVFRGKDNVASLKLSEEAMRVVVRFYNEVYERMTPGLLQERQKRHGEELQAPDELILEIFQAQLEDLKKRQDMTRETLQEYAGDAQIEVAFMEQLAALEDLKTPELPLLEKSLNIVRPPWERATDRRSPRGGALRRLGTSSSAGSTDDLRVGKRRSTGAGDGVRSSFDPLGARIHSPQSALEVLEEDVRGNLNKFVTELSSLHDQFLMAKKESRDYSEDSELRSARVAGLKASAAQIEEQRQAFIAALAIARGEEEKDDDKEKGRSRRRKADESPSPSPRPRTQDRDGAKKSRRSTRGEEAASGASNVPQEPWLPAFADAGKTKVTVKMLVEQEKALEELQEEEKVLDRQSERLKQVDKKRREAVFDFLDRDRDKVLRLAAAVRQEEEWTGALEKVKRKGPLAKKKSTEKDLKKLTAEWKDSKLLQDAEEYEALKTKMEVCQTSAEASVTELQDVVDQIRKLTISHDLTAASFSGDRSDWKKMFKQFQDMHAESKEQKAEAALALLAMDARHTTRCLTAREAREVRLPGEPGPGTVKGQLAELLCLERECNDRLARMQEMSSAVRELRNQWRDGKGKQGAVAESRAFRQESRQLQLMVTRKKRDVLAQVRAQVEAEAAADAAEEAQAAVERKLAADVAALQPAKRGVARGL